MASAARTCRFLRSFRVGAFNAPRLLGAWPALPARPFSFRLGFAATAAVGAATVFGTAGSLACEEAPPSPNAERKMRIVLQEDLTIRGGAQLWLMNCGARLNQAGCDVTFILPSDSQLLDDVVKIEGVKVHTYPRDLIAENPEAYREFFTSLLKPADVCVTLVRQKRGKFQNVSFLASCIEQADLGTFLVAKTGTPDASYEKSFYGGALLEREPVQCCVITIAEYTRQFIMDHMGVDGKYITNIYNGTDTAKFRRTPEMAVEAKNQYPLGDGDFVVGCIGSFEPRKGQKVLLDAAKLLVDDGRVPNIHVLMVGEGPDKEMLMNTISDHGLEGHASIFDFTKQPFYVFERCDVIALPSFKEGLPNVLLEALAMEKPCVASRIMGCPEVVIDGETGYCFEAGDAKGLADSLAQIHGLDSDSRQQMAATGRDLVFKEHDKKVQFEKILTLLQDRASAVPPRVPELDLPTALVIGSGYVGDEVARQLRAEGYRVLTGRPGNSADVQVDISKADSIGGLGSQIPKGVDHVVCIADHTSFGDLESFNSASVIEGFESNLHGMARLATMLINGKEVQVLKDGGSVTLTSCVAGSSANRNWPVISASSSAMDAFVRSAGLDAPRGCRLNAVALTLVSETARDVGRSTAHAVSAADTGARFLECVTGERTGEVLSCAIRTARGF